MSWQLASWLLLGGSTVLLFLGLVRYGYLWIFAPLRKLHQGASRVALGDFEYRLKLNSNDEMAELAVGMDQVENADDALPRSVCRVTVAAADLEAGEKVRPVIADGRPIAQILLVQVVNIAGIGAQDGIEIHFGEGSSFACLVHLGLATCTAAARRSTRRYLAPVA